MKFNTNFVVKLKGIKYLFFLILLLGSMAGCFPYAKLSDGETRLKKNEVIVEEVDLARKAKAQLKSDLANNYQQAPNESLLGLHLDTRLYYSTDEPGDTSKFKNWLRKSVVERPAVYDKNASKATAKSMAFFLQNKGYLEATVRDTSFTDKQNTNVQYIADPGDLYVVCLLYTSPSPRDGLLSRMPSSA